MAERFLYLVAPIPLLTSEGGHIQAAYERPHTHRGPETNLSNNIGKMNDRAHDRVEENLYSLN